MARYSLNYTYLLQLWKYDEEKKLVHRDKIGVVSPKLNEFFTLAVWENYYMTDRRHKPKEASRLCLYNADKFLVPSRTLIEIVDDALKAKKEKNSR